MKKLILSTALFLTLFGGIWSQTITNHPESTYKFESIASYEATPVLNQGMSGTCWSFSALSFFESEIMRLKKEQIVLSEMYVVRHAYYEKALKYIRMNGKINFGEGGAFHDIPYIMKRYGIVPAVEYTGLRVDEDRINHKELFNALEGFMGGILKTAHDLRRNETLSDSWKGGISGILDAYLGSVPKNFNHKGKSYTPQSFADYLKLNMDDYVSITSFTHFSMYEKCMLEIPDNWSWGMSYNVSLDDMVRINEHALKNGYTVAWGADVSEGGFNFREGIAIVPEDPSTIQSQGSDNRNFSDPGAVRSSNAFREPVKELEITPELRQKGYDNLTTQDDHGMHITGLFKEANGTMYYLVKNSWGTSNHPKGYLFVSQNYFKHKTINIYLHKDALPSDVRKKLRLE